MIKAHSGVALLALAALLAGCAQTPAQVSATEPVRTVSISASVPDMVRCLPAKLEDLYAGWTIAVRGDALRPRIQAHGGIEIGTVAIIDLDDRRAVIRLSPNVVTPGYMADQLESAMKSCDPHRI